MYMISFLLIWSYKQKYDSNLKVYYMTIIMKKEPQSNKQKQNKIIQL